MARKTPKPKSRASDAEVAARVAEILEIRLDGVEFSDVVSFCKEKGFNVSERQCGRYLEAADKLIVERCERSRKKLLTRHIAQRQKLFARCVNAASHRDALAVLADLAKLQGLYPSEHDLKALAKQQAEQNQKVKDLENRLGGRESTTEPVAPEPDAT